MGCVIHDKFIKSDAKVIMSYSIEDVIDTIKDKLTNSQKEMFSKTCFVAFLNITKFTPSPQLLYNMRCRIANVSDSTSNEMHFDICWKLLCYSLRHFAMSTGLKYDGDVNYKYIVTSERSQYAKSYFKQTTRFNRDTLKS